MHNLEPLINKCHRRLTYLHFKKTPHELDKEDHNKYLYTLALAEVLACMKSVIPEEYLDYTILDYTGQIVEENKRGISEAKQVVPIDLTLDVKEKICKFCYNQSWSTIKKICEKSKDKALTFMNDHNCMNVRLNNAENVVIHGERGEKTGRTMLASLLMKEAIYGRSIHEEMKYNNYGWVSYWPLIQSLHNDYDASEYSTCEWLVVDDIVNTVKTPTQKTHYNSILDPLFCERYKFRLPTILIFKFDIRKDVDLENNFGSGIAKIVGSPRTTIISLTELADL